MKYLQIIEPRQQGKTSFVNRLIYRAALTDMVIAYVDASTIDHSTEVRCYHSLCQRILEQWQEFIPPAQRPALPTNSIEWRGFLHEIAAYARAAQRRILIALDEIGAADLPNATSFFSVLRDVYNSREAQAAFGNLTFLLAGAFRPRDLIDDDSISPFNIAQRLRLPDFTAAQMHDLIAKGGWPEEQARSLSERIHYWTDGHPYLTQLLCSYLGPEAKPTHVDQGIEQVLREDLNNLPPLLKALNKDSQLRAYVEGIRTGNRIKFYPQASQRQAQLELLGVLKVDGDGYCSIRNRIYEQALSAAWEDFDSPTKELRRCRPSHQEGEQEMIPKSLTEKLREGKVIPFVGAGVSMAVRRLGEDQPLFPSWRGLLAGAADRLEQERKAAYAGVVRNILDLPQPDFLEAARWAREGLGSAWVGYLKQQIERTSDEASPESLALARAVWDLGSRLIVTTNYDQVMQWACPPALRDSFDFWDIQAPAEQAQLLQKVQPIRPTVWHLHGRIGNAANIILTPDGYRELYPSKGRRANRYKAALETLRQILVSRSLLFIGFSLDDADFGAQIRGVSEVFEGNTGPHYALVLTKDAHRLKEKGLPVELVTVEKLGEPLLALVQQLGTVANA